jgi:hypothetical protein
MKKSLLIILSIVILSGCNYFSNKKDKILGKWIYETKSISGFMCKITLDFSESGKCYTTTENYLVPIHKYERDAKLMELFFNNKKQIAKDYEVKDGKILIGGKEGQEIFEIISDNEIATESGTSQFLAAFTDQGLLDNNGKIVFKRETKVKRKKSLDDITEETFNKCKDVSSKKECIDEIYEEQLKRLIDISAKILVRLKRLREPLDEISDRQKRVQDQSFSICPDYVKGIKEKTIRDLEECKCFFTFTEEEIKEFEKRLSELQKEDDKNVDYDKEVQQLLKDANGSEGEKHYDKEKMKQNKEKQNRIQEENQIPADTMAY